jgi:ribosomal protein L40E
MGVPGQSHTDDDHLPIDLRDALTRRRLERAAAHLAGVEFLEFDNDWWDGQAHAPCLIVRGGRRGRMLRVIETAGEAVVVPFDRRTAQRWLAERRRPPRPELSMPAQRAADDIVLDASVDALRCPSRQCGALLPLDYAGACPVCGEGQLRPRSARE